MKAIRVQEYGGPEVLRLEEVATPTPGAGQVLVRLVMAGVNFIDIYQRRGSYPMSLPFIPGREGAGTVEAVGEGVTQFVPGDRVAYASVQGAYAEYAVAPAWRLVPLPAEVDAQHAAAVMIQGMTAHYLTHSTYPLKPGETALVHAAGGGTGQLLTQIAKRLGARVIATASTEEKAQRARESGAGEVILYTQADFEVEVKRLTNGAGVDVVYDSVGQTTFDKSLNCVGVRGVLALFGQSSGPVPPVDPARLAKNAVFLTRPGLAQYTATRAELLERAGEVLGWVMSGQLKLLISHTLPLKDAAEAHRLLEGRKTTGKVLLVP